MIIKRLGLDLAYDIVRAGLVTGVDQGTQSTHSDQSDFIAVFETDSPLLPFLAVKFTQHCRFQQKLAIRCGAGCAKSLAPAWPRTALRRDHKAIALDTQIHLVA